MGIFSWANPVGDVNATFDNIHNEGIESLFKDGDLIKNTKDALAAGKSMSEAAKVCLEGVNQALPYAQLFMAFSSFAAAASGFCAIANTLCGIQAQRHLAAASKEIAAHLKAMSADLKDINNAAQAGLNLAYQLDFAQHVHDYVAMQAELTASSTRPHYVFVYHPGDDWHGAFYRLCKESPINGFCGLTNNINLLLAWLPEFRRIVGPDAQISVLLPTAHLYVLPDALTIDPAIGPLTLTGEVHHTGKPYTFLTVTDMTNLECHGVTAVVHQPPLGESGKRSVGYKIAKYSAASVAGAGTGVAGTAAAYIFAIGLISVCPPLAGAVIASEAALALATGGVMLGSLASGAVAGTAAGVGVSQAFKR